MEYATCCVVYISILFVILAIMYSTGFLKYISQVWFAMFSNYISPKYNRKVAEYKKELFAQLVKGEKEEMSILEIGCGPGGNLHVYPTDLPVKLIAVEPNIHHKKYLLKNLEKYDNITLERYVVCCAENMKDIESNSMEIVISTIVLCSVDDQTEVLREIKRVLKPCGKFYFLEHVAGEPGSWMYFIQTAVNACWGIINDGCNVNRRTADAINSAGFVEVNLKSFMVKFDLFSSPLRPHIAGYAMK